MPWSVYNSDGKLLQSLAIADDSIVEGKLDVSNAPTNGYFLQAQSGEGGGLTWAAATTAEHGASSHTNIAKSLFIPSMGAHIAQGFTVVNGGRHHALRAADGADCRGTFTMRVPDDFVSFTSIKMLWQTPATSGNLVFLCYFHWAGVGEADSTNAETGTQQTVATGGAEVFVLSEMGDIALSGLAAKDFLGGEFRCYRNNGSDTLSNHVDVLGWEFNYVASQ